MTKARPVWQLAVAAAVSAFPCWAQISLTANLVTADTLHSRLERGTVKPNARQDAVHALFEESGCQPADQRVGRNSANVICTSPGASEAAIIIGAHFDFVNRGQGIVDDWSGIALLPSLYEALRIAPRKHTFVFVAFTEEEIGLHGSSRYIQELNKAQRSRVRAFVNLESLGMGETNVWIHRATPMLVSKLMEVANAVHADVRGVDADAFGDDDSHPFLDARLPVITLHSVTQETLPVLHSARDSISAIRMEDYYATYKLVAYYLAYLDSQLD